jgi:hypothetical protein
MEDIPIIGKQPEPKVPEELDIILWVTIAGTEIPTEIPRKDPDPDWTQPFIRLRSYFTKRVIVIFPRNFTIVERLAEAEYLINLEDARVRQAMMQGQTRGGIVLPRGTIPGKRHNN